MRPNVGTHNPYWVGKKVVVTGGTGFLGWHLTQQLRERGANVTVLALAPSLAHPIYRFGDITKIWGDIRDKDTVRRALAECDLVFHTAGVVGAWGHILDSIWSVHVDGTRNVLEQARSGLRIIHTSSLTTVGASPRGRVLDENATFLLQNSKLHYVAAKRAAEMLALEAAAAGADLVITNPGYLVGPDDYEHSIMARLCLRYWKGRIPLVPPGGLNLADVRDVAHGHLLAAEHGQSGRRYILGGENHHFGSFFRLLAHVAASRPRAYLPIPWVGLLFVAGLAELRARFSGREPYPSLGHVRLNSYCWFGNSARAESELGYT